MSHPLVGKIVDLCQYADAHVLWGRIRVLDVAEGWLRAEPQPPFYGGAVPDGPVWIPSRCIAYLMESKEPQ